MIQVKDEFMQRYVIYLHGFLSSSDSLKARMIQEFAEQKGFTAFIHELYPSVRVFNEMTITSQVQRLMDAFDEHGFDDYVIAGSSFGGLIALNFLGRFLPNNKIPKPRGVLLLAPALWFHRINIELLSEKVLMEWERLGVARFYHPGLQQEVELHYGFYRSLYESIAENTIPPDNTVIIHGKRDKVVPLEFSLRFQERYPHVVLREVDDDHNLGSSFPVIQEELLKLLES